MMDRCSLFCYTVFRQNTGEPVVKIEKRVFDTFIYVKKAKIRHIIRFNEEPFAIRGTGTYISRDLNGCEWFESPEKLKEFYTLVSNIGENSFLVRTKLTIKTLNTDFLVKRNGELWFEGRPGDVIFEYKSGACFLWRMLSKNSGLRIPINVDTASNTRFSIVF